MKIAKILALCLLLGGCSKEIVYNESVKPTGSDLEIFVGSDLHYIADDLKKDSTLFKTVSDRSDGKNMHYIEEITDVMVNDVIKAKPDALILTGDLTYNGEKLSHIALAEKLKLIEEQGIPVLVIDGNHDINNYGAYKFLDETVERTDSITPKEFKEIYQEFGYSDALYQDSTSLSYVNAISEDLWVFMIDSVEYNKNSELIPSYNAGDVKTSTIQWIEKCLKAAEEKGAKVIFGMHHNLFYHSELFPHGYRLEDNEALLNLMKTYNVPLSLSGHIHLQNIIKDEGSEIVDIASGALSVYAHSLGHLSFDPKGTIEYQAVPLGIEDWAKETEKTDVNLLDFRDFSRKFYTMAAYNRELNRIDPEDQVALTQAQIMSLLNAYYFSGTVDNEVRVMFSEDEMIQSMIQDSESTRSIYIQSILKDKGYSDLEIAVEFK